MNTYELIKDRISSKRLYKTVKDLTAFHRIQASTTYRKAANHVMDLCKTYHLDATLMEYEADPDKWYLQNKMFMEWDIKEATLDLEDGHRLCDYTSEPISVIQKSYPCDYRNNPLDLVYLDKSDKAEDYEDVDFKGKMVFTHYWHDSVSWIYDKGALGILTDCIREDANRKRHDLYDSLTYTSFWHNHDEKQKPVFGFVVSPKVGDTLEKKCLELKKENRYLKVKPYINSSLYNGHIEVIEVKIQGQDDKRVMLNAHLCHPSSSANDNASGVAATLEAMHVLNELIEEGRIKRPEHTIVLTLVPEFTGSFAYLSDHHDHEIIGGINVDMVGARQDRTNGPITLSKMPMANPSIINEISTYAMREAAKEAKSHDGNDIALTSYLIEDFSLGSDHTLYTDPGVSYGCCMLGQWPDRNYHTSTDTIDKIDPEVLKFSSTVVTVFAYKLSNFSADDLNDIFEEMRLEITDNLYKINNKYHEGTIDLDMYKKAIHKQYCYYKDSVKSITRLIDDNPLEEKMLRYVDSQYLSMMDYMGVEDEVFYIIDDERVYKRNYLGTINDVEENRALGYGEAIDEYFNEVKDFDFMKRLSINTLTEYYINGKNCVDMIVNEVNAELLGHYDEAVKAYIRLLEKMNKISLV